LLYSRCNRKGNHTQRLAPITGALKTNKPAAIGRFFHQATPMTTYPNKCNQGAKTGLGAPLAHLAHTKGLPDVPKPLLYYRNFSVLRRGFWFVEPMPKEFALFEYRWNYARAYVKELNRLNAKCSK
jgi:hypothetical protein